ncbi:General transcription factor IIH subunit 4 [Paramuricea clavata]|uniref:General transcription factor IIH subunit 4 n=1 Tax=Paramuricea clavata TaxID=317549 RepID=A0A6S7HMH1_PARCT|nr:General transcription factor IIH subunit 4 [Paramuricea clavata]
MAAGGKQEAAPFGRHLKCKDLHQYLQGLPVSVLDKLYGHPATCFAVFRELPELAKHFVMRTLFAEQPLPETLVNAWVKKEQQNFCTGALNRLKQLRIWRVVTGWSQTRYELNPTFRSNLKIALCGGGQPWCGVADDLGPDRHSKDKEFLDKYALERWEAVLHFMTGSSPPDGTVGISADVVQVLLVSGLMKSDEQEQSPMITPSGFQFLLMDASSQIWYFMLKYLDMVEARGMNLVECLSFLFQLNFSTFGKDYPTDNMSDSQLRFLQHLREIGLVFQRKRKSRRYYPTKLVINLAAAGSGSMTTASEGVEGFIVVETNYRVYVYTDSPLQVALVGLFAEIICRFPKFCVAVLTRGSVSQALLSGITADQVLHFLRTRAHPEMLKKTPVIPANIADQIRLWELEKCRMQMTEGVLYNQFLSMSDFETLRKYAEDLGVLIWANSNKRVMIVSKSGHDDVKKFWKRQKPRE